MNKNKTIIWSVVGVILALLVVFVVGFATKWFGTAVDVVSPNNVKAQYEQVIDKFEAMSASAKNACTVQKSSLTENKRSATLVEDPMLAYSATFNRNVADYNSAMDNLFKAKIVAPAGYPSSVDVNQIDTEDWCTVDKQLRNLKS